MKNCPHCQGSGITRLDWVKVPVWQACICAPTGGLSVPITWNWPTVSIPAVATAELQLAVTAPA